MRTRPRSGRQSGARIILLAAGGTPNRQIATELEMSEQAVGKWRRRFERLRFNLDFRSSSSPETLRAS